MYLGWLISTKVFAIGKSHRTDNAIYRNPLYSKLCLGLDARLEAFLAKPAGKNILSKTSHGHVSLCLYTLLRWYTPCDFVSGRGAAQVPST